MRPAVQCEPENAFRNYRIHSYRLLEMPEGLFVESEGIGVPVPGTRGFQAAKHVVKDVAT